MRRGIAALSGPRPCLLSPKSFACIRRKTQIPNRRNFHRHLPAVPNQAPSGIDRRRGDSWHSTGDPEHHQRDRAPARPIAHLQQSPSHQRPSRADQERALWSRELSSIHKRSSHRRRNRARRNQLNGSNHAQISRHQKERNANHCHTRRPLHADELSSSHARFMAH